MAFIKLKKAGFDLVSNHHANAIFDGVFPSLAEEIEEVLSRLKIKVSELVAGGGGEASMTQRLRRELTDSGWKKHEFIVEKLIDGVSTISQTHEIDHVRRHENSTIGLEIEWNNKDPFYDRDLENFSRLHADSAIAVGVIITRGKSLHQSLEKLVEEYALRHNLTDFPDLQLK
ncbi:MAG: restriction endonuclease, partial [Opitutae bacterium]|nr:restriction endonuclease [Opitutae bacterium]